MEKALIMTINPKKHPGRDYAIFLAVQKSLAVKCFSNLEKVREQPIFLKYQLAIMKSATPIRIILADDHEIFRDGFKVMIKKQPSVQLVAEASNGEELVALTREHKPDV